MPPLSYQWPFNGPNIDGATNATVVITNVQASNLGTYSVLVMNQLGSAFSPGAMLSLAEVIAWGDNSYGQTNVPTQSGRVYRLEDKNALTDSAWTPLPLIAGNGRTQVLSDATAAAAQRFYRVRQW